MSKLIITDNAEWVIPTGDKVSVVGTNDENMVAVAQGVSVAFDGSFNRGNDGVYIQADSGEFQVSLAGSTVTLTHTDGSTISIGAGTAGQALTFGDGFLNLMIDTSGETDVVMLGDQALVMDADPVALTAAVDGSVTSDDAFATGMNTAPDAADDAFADGIFVDTQADLDVLGNDDDADGDAVVFDTTADIVVTGPEGATATAVYDTVNNDINFTADTAGDYTFDYAVKDGHGGTDTASVTVTVSDSFPGIDLVEGTSDPVAATDDADIFAFDAVAALGMTDNTQIVISGFDTAADSLQLDIATAGGLDSLDDLNGVDGISVQTNIITGTTINFGNDADGDVVVIQLAGVTDASLVQIEAV